MPSVPVEKLNRCHPTYRLYAGLWGQMEVFNESGQKLKNEAQTYLTRRPKEPDEVFRERLRRMTSGPPILGTILGWYNSALFRREPQITFPTDDFYEAFIDNCDQANTTYLNLWSKIFQQFLLFGRGWLLIDKPNPGDELPATLADEIDRGLDRPYLVNYDPRQVINWGTDPYGNLDWVLIKWIKEDSEFLSDGKNRRVVWCYYDRTQYQRYEAVITADDSIEQPGVTNILQNVQQVADMVASGPHALAGANIVPVYHYVMPPALWLANRISLQLMDYFNQENTYCWALFNANLAMPVVFTEGDPALTLGEAYYLKLGQKDRVEWLEPTGVSFTHSAERLQSIREEIYRACYLQAQGRSSSASASASSGYSKELDMMPANDVLNAMGDIVRAGMTQTLKLISAARGEVNADFSVTGFQFESKPATETVALAQEVSDLGIDSDTLDRELKKRVGRDSLPDATPDLRKKIDAEIDAAPSLSEKQAQAATQQAAIFQKTFETHQNREQAKEEDASLVS